MQFEKDRFWTLDALLHRDSTGSLGFPLGAVFVQAEPLMLSIPRRAIWPMIR